MTLADIAASNSSVLATWFRSTSASALLRRLNSLLCADLVTFSDHLARLILVDRQAQYDRYAA